MAAPNISYTASGAIVSKVSGFDHITVRFSADMAYKAFECRATKLGEDWGRGKGALVASFSSTPANTVREFEVYDDFLTNGEGDYRISLFAQGVDGSWNDNESFVPANSGGMLTLDGYKFLCMREG